MDYDFTGLTRKQQQLMTFQGWTLQDGPGVQPSPRQVEKLLKRGLIVAQARADNACSWMEYIVPVHIHMLWCDYCSHQKFPEVE